MKMNMAEENNRMYNEFKEKGSDLVADINKPFYLLACRLYGIMLEPLSNGRAREGGFVNKHTYILHHFQADYERMKSMGRLGNPVNLSLFERQFGLYGEPDTTLSEEEENIALLTGMALGNYMKYIFNRGQWTLIWDAIDTDDMYIKVLPVEFIPGLSFDALKLLKILGIQTYADLREYMHGGVSAVLSNIASLSSNKRVREEIQGVLDKKYF